MKNIHILLIIVVILGAIYIGISKHGGDTDEFARTATFACASGESFTIGYPNLDNTETAVLLFDGKTRELERAVSASGARYANQNESLVFWEHAGAASVEKDGETIYQDCTVAGVENNDTLHGNTWVWQETVYNDGTVVTPNKEGAFTLTFLEEGRFAAKTDCNGAGGNYTREGDSLSFGEIFTTLMACPGVVQESEYVSMLEQVNAYTANHELILMFPGGEMSFTQLEE